MEAAPAIDLPAGLFYITLLLVTVIVVRWKPVAAAFLLIVSDPYGLPHHLWHTDVTTTKVVVIGSLLALALRGALARVFGRRSFRWLFLAGTGVVAANALTAIPGEYIDVVAREILKSIEYLAIFLVAAASFHEDPDDRAVWLGLVICAASVSLLALVQERSVAPSVAIVGGHVLNRIAGPLEGPNQLAGFYDVAVPMLVALVVARRGLWTGCALALSVVTDILTLSRAGFLGLGAGTAAVLLKSGIARSRTSLVAGAGILAVVVALVVKQGSLERFESIHEVDTGTGLGTRSELWGAALRFFTTHPLLGIGAGNFELELPTIGLLGIRTHANSLYLQSLAEGGIVLFVATIAVIAVALRTLYFARETTPYTLGAGAATIALAAHQVFDDVTFFPKVGGFWWIWLGIAAASTMTKREREESGS